MNVGRMYGRGDVRANMTRHAGMGLSYPTDRLMPGDTTLWGDMVGEAVYGDPGVISEADANANYWDSQTNQARMMLFAGVGAAALILFLALRR